MGESRSGRRPLGLIDQLGEAVLELEADGRVAHANPAAGALFGRSQLDLVGRPASEFMRGAPSSSNVAGPPALTAVHDGEEAAGVRADGAEFPVELRVTPLADDASLVVIRDITGQVQERDELRVARRRLAESEQLARVGSWEWDIRANTVTWSDQLFRIYGLEPGAVTPTYERFLAYVHPDDRDDVDARNRKAFADHQPFADVKRVVCADGREIQMRTQGEVFCDDAGAPVRMVGVCEDVTDQYRANELLARLSSIVQSTGDAVVGLTAGGVITSWNPSAERLYGYRAEDVVGRDAMQLLDRGDALGNAIALAVESGVITHLESDQVRGDGQHVGVSLTVSPIVRDDGSIDGASLIAPAAPRPLGP